MRKFWPGKSWWILFLALAVIGGLRSMGYFSPKPQVSSAREPSSTGRVTKQDLTQRVTVAGQVIPRKRMDVRPPFNGYVQKLFVKVGDRLKANAPIVTFSSAPNPGETNYPLRTAFAGVVTQVLKTEGEYVLETNEQNLVVRIEDTSELYVLATIPEMDVLKIKVGQQALVRTSATQSRSYKGLIQEIHLSAKEKDRYSNTSGSEFQAKILIQDSSAELWPGMTATLDIITDKRTQVLTLRHEFLHKEEDQYFILTPSGQRQNVTLGLRNEEAAEIIEGAREGDAAQIVNFLDVPGVE